MIEVEAGEDVALETRDANDGQIGPRTTAKDLERLERNVAHPLTGPVYIKGAKPGDLLEVEYLDIVPQTYGWTRFAPGGGFLKCKMEALGMRVLLGKQTEALLGNGRVEGLKFTSGEELEVYRKEPAKN